MHKYYLSNLIHSVTLKLFLIIFLFGLIITLIVSQESKSYNTIHLLYQHPNVNTINQSLQTLSDDTKHTYNTYIQEPSINDPRFINKLYRENGVDISLRLLRLTSNEKVQFLIHSNLNHHFQVRNASTKIKADSSVQNLKIFLNKKQITNYRLLSSSQKNLLEIENTGQEIFLQDLVLIPESKKSQPNVLFIVVDSLRADVLGAYRAKFNASPNIDEFSKNAYTFERNYVNSSWTRPSTLIFFTGRYASKNFINFWDYPVFLEERKSFYESNIQPLPVKLAQNGYESVMIGNNPFLTDHRYMGVDTGFEKLYDFSPKENDTIPITEHTLNYLKYRDTSRPFFLFLNYNDPHRPYTPPAKYRNQLKNVKNLDSRKVDYLGEVAYVDAEIQRVFDHLKSIGQFDNTLILLTSDHGEVMNPVHKHSKFTDVYTLYGHGQGLFEEDIHTPLVIKYPNQKTAKSFSNITRSIDLMPTILEVVQDKFFNHEMDGKSITSIVENKEKENRLYYGESRGVKGIIHKEYKYMQKTFEFHRLGYSWNGKVEAEPSYLYNLKLDPEETTPIRDDQLEKELSQIINKYRQKPTIYSVQINHPKKSKSKKISISVQIKSGKILTLDTNYIPSPNQQITNIENGIVFQKDLSKMNTTKLNFQVYPDIQIPIIDILLDGKPLDKTTFGVGERDVYPDHCTLQSLNCSELYSIFNREPNPTDEFRIQMWKQGNRVYNQVQTNLLEKEALDILRKQGYIH